MNPKIEEYIELAERYEKEAQNYRKKVGKNVESGTGRDMKKTLLIASNYYANMANYYATRALIEKLNEK